LPSIGQNGRCRLVTRAIRPLIGADFYNLWGSGRFLCFLRCRLFGVSSVWLAHCSADCLSCIALAAGLLWRRFSLVARPLGLSAVFPGGQLLWQIRFGLSFALSIVFRTMPMVAWPFSLLQLDNLGAPADCLSSEALVAAESQVSVHHSAPIVFRAHLSLLFGGSLLSSSIVNLLSVTVCHCLSLSRLSNFVALVFYRPVLSSVLAGTPPAYASCTR